jgi:hypothetical protein
MDFKKELEIIDKYVEIKDSGAGEELVLDLILNYFIPQGRFEEARSWKTVLTNKDLKHKADEAYKTNIANHKVSSITRIPQNDEWHDQNPEKPSDNTDDQQYHYDRTLTWANATKCMFDEIEDVKTCRNEWITFVARNAFEDGLDKKGVEFNTLAMAFSDYIEFILLPGRFISGNSNQSPQESKGYTVAEVYENIPEMLDYLRARAPEFLKEIFLLDFYCQLGVAGDIEAVVVTESLVAFVPEKKYGRKAGNLNFIPTQNISSIIVGTDFHTDYQGFSSSSSTYWTLTFTTTQYQEFSRWLYLGSKEADMNQNRPRLGQILEKLGEHFELVQGDSFATSSGYTTSIGYGFWV